jgi:hypothetical protein
LNQTQSAANTSGSSAQIRSTDGATVVDIADGKVTLTAGTEVKVVSPRGCSPGARKLVEHLETCPGIMRSLLEASLGMVDVTLSSLLALMVPRIRADTVRQRQSCAKCTAACTPWTYSIDKML